MNSILSYYILLYIIILYIIMNSIYIYQPRSEPSLAGVLQYYDQMQFVHLGYVAGFRGLYEAFENEAQPLLCSCMFTQLELLLGMKQLRKYMYTYIYILSIFLLEEKRRVKVVCPRNLTNFQQNRK